jgi:hypothetical protein
MRRWIVVGLVVVAVVVITIAAKHHKPSQAEVPCVSPPPGSACL